MLGQDETNTRQHPQQGFKPYSVHHYCSATVLQGHYRKTLRHPQNRKYATYYNDTRGKPSHSHGKQAQKIRETRGFRDMRSHRRTQTQKDTRTRASSQNTAPLPGCGNNSRTELQCCTWVGDRKPRGSTGDGDIRRALYVGVHRRQLKPPAGRAATPTPDAINILREVLEE